MLGTALYFPYIDIRDPVWLRSTLLFWDDIQTIVPSAIERPYQTEDTDICFKEEVLKPLHCDLHQDVIEELGRKVTNLGNRGSYIERAIRKVNPAVSDLIRSLKSTPNEVEDAFIEMGLHPAKMSPEVRYLALKFSISRLHQGKIPPHLRRMLRDVETGRVHAEKLSYELRDLYDRSRYQDEDGEWLLVDSNFAHAYMSALAAKLSTQLSLSPLTSESKAHGMSFRFLFDEIVDGSSQSAPGALMTVAMRSLSVDASVPIGKIIDFKRKRRDQYLEFKAQVNELSEKISSSDLDPDEIMIEAEKIYRTKIDRGLRQLKRELDHQSISSVWEGAFTAATVSTSATTALAYFSHLTGPALLGAGAAVAVSAIGVRGYLAGKKMRINNPYSYLHDLKDNFGLPEFI